MIQHLQTVRKFKSIDLESAEETIKSFERHLGYLSEELVVFFLFDDSVNYAKKTMMGQKLINLPRPKVFTPYKPKTPIVIWRDEEKPFSSSFISEKLWLLFHLLKLNRPQCFVGDLKIVLNSKFFVLSVFRSNFITDKNPD